MISLVLSTAIAGDWATLRLQDGYAVDLQEDAIGVDQSGRPHIVWAGQDTVHHAMLDGSWSIEEIVDPAELDGPPQSATAVVRNQTVHVAWSQPGVPPLHAEGSWNNWTWGTVWTIGPTSHHPVIGLSPDGNKYVADADGRLVLPHQEGAYWVDAITTLGVLGARPDLAFASDSTPWLVWEAGPELHYADLPGLQQYPPVTNPVVPALGPASAVVDGADQLVVGVHDGDLVRLLRNIGADWSSWTIEQAPNAGLGPALSVDPSGLVHAAYTNGTQVRYALETSPGSFQVENAVAASHGPVSIHATASDVHVAHLADDVLSYGTRDSSAIWSWEQIAETHRPGFGVGAVHDGTGVWVAHQDGGEATDGLPRRLVLTWSDGTTVTHSVENVGDIYADTELALGSDGLLRMTRVDQDVEELVLMTGQAGSWTLEVASRPGDAPREHALAVDPSTDLAVVAYLTDSGEVVVATQEASGWTHQAVPSSYGGTIDVAVDDDGYVRVLWGDPDARDPMLGTALVGDPLTVETLEPLNQIARTDRRVAIAVDAKGGARVLYEFATRGSDFNGFEAEWYVMYARERSDGWESDLLGPLTGPVSDLDVVVEESGTTHFVIAEENGPVYVGTAGGAVGFSLDLVATNGRGAATLAQAPDDTLYAAWQDSIRWDLNLSLARPELSLSTDTMAFGEVYLGESAEQTVTITNTGSTDIPLPPPLLEGAHAQDYELVGTCFSDLQPNGFCTWTVRFVPELQGERLATLTLAPGHVVELSGTGVGTFDTSGCSEDGCGGCAQGGGAPWTLAFLLGWLTRRRSTAR